MCCRKFFGFDDQFDPTQLMVRSNENEKKRNIYFSSKSIRNIALRNEHKIKVCYILLGHTYVYGTLMSKPVYHMYVYIYAYRILYIYMCVFGLTLTYL